MKRRQYTQTLTRQALLSAGLAQSAASLNIQQDRFRISALRITAEYIQVIPISEVSSQLQRLSIILIFKNIQVPTDT